jgi:hypothetical protein
VVPLKASKLSAQKLDHFGAKMLEKLAHLIFISPKIFFFSTFWTISRLAE